MKTWLSDRLEGRYSARLRTEGLADLVRGAVEIQRVDAGRVQAFVKGRARHDLVIVELGGGEPRISCTCSLVRPGAPCRHQWATLLAVESAARADGRVSQRIAQGARDFLAAAAGSEPDPEPEPGPEPAPAVLPSPVGADAPIGVPRPRLLVRVPPAGEARTEFLLARVSFDYGEGERPDPVAEREWLARLWAGGGLPFERDPANRRGQLRAAEFLRTAGLLLAEGWTIESQGRPIRSPDEFSVQVRSGVDWFDLKGGAVYGGKVVAFPDLLAASRKGERLVELPDGGLGLVPEDWFDRSRALLSLARARGSSLRFHASQGWILDALLAALPRAEVDDAFEAHRERLRTMGEAGPADPPPSFRGVLRPYQREGLGWLLFLREAGLGGCLADDMGLGKTIQVLALLETARAAHELAHPFLVVAPRSVVPNWIEEASRFCPGVRVLDYSGRTRRVDLARLDEFELVLTTYGVLRRDVHELRERTFDTVVLDEAQAVKNADSQTAKGSRLLSSLHRLALSGTPVENRISELWSLLEFLNPGMLGRSSAFRALLASGEGTCLGPAERETIATAVRPFLLRRTKRQVASDLPDRIEQTIHCELEPAQRERYEDLREYCRANVAGWIAEKGLARSRLAVLESLLRLRQAACHPGLLDPALAGESCPKFEALIPRLEELAAEGHKALVFSQFTSFLALLRPRLDEAGLVHEYLDGQTADRQARIERFQRDPECPVFVLSLRAGGVGLNLTAASYVFLLDPWWNPAVEAQAIDRAHRIGQDRTVFAYRLVARDTIEEKILELQSIKRELADAILSEDRGALAGLGVDDLAALFG